MNDVFSVVEYDFREINLFGSKCGAPFDADDIGVGHGLVRSPDLGNKAPVRAR